jgi:hypothetical protein
MPTYKTFLFFLRLSFFSINKSLLYIYCSRSGKAHIFWKDVQPKNVKF